MNQTDWGHFDIILAEYLENHGISKNKLAAAANLQRSQLISYCKNEVQRPDLSVMARICCALSCDLNDIIKYRPPIGDHPSITSKNIRGVHHE